MGPTRVTALSTITAPDVNWYMMIVVLTPVVTVSYKYLFTSGTLHLHCSTVVIIFSLFSSSSIQLNTSFSQYRTLESGYDTPALIQDEVHTQSQFEFDISLPSIRCHC